MPDWLAEEALTKQIVQAMHNASRSSEFSDRVSVLDTIALTRPRGGAYLELTRTCASYVSAMSFWAKRHIPACSRNGTDATCTSGMRTYCSLGVKDCVHMCLGGAPEGWSIALTRLYCARQCVLGLTLTHC